jgi:hypothetical protein
MNIIMSKRRIEKKKVNPLTHHLFQNERIFFYLIQLNVNQLLFIIKNYIKKEYISPKKLQKKNKNIILSYIRFHTITIT